MCGGCCVRRRDEQEKWVGIDGPLQWIALIRMLIFFEAKKCAKLILATAILKFCNKSNSPQLFEIIWSLHFLFTKLPWPGNSEGIFLDFESVSICPPVYYTRRKLHTVLFIAERQTGNLWIPIFYSLWFDPTRNRTLVYRFSSKPFIHSNTDRLFVQITFSAKPFSQSTARSSPPWSCLGSCYIDILAMCVCVLLRD